MCFLSDSVPMSLNISRHDASPLQWHHSSHGFQRAKGNGIHPSLQGQAPEAPVVDNMFVTDHWAIFQSDTSPLPVSSKAQVIRKVGIFCDEGFETQPPSHTVSWKTSKPQYSIGFICKSLSPRLIVQNNGPDPSAQKDNWQAQQRLFI